MERSDVCLIAPPLGIVTVPSLALGLLKAEAEQAGLAAEVLYANLLFADAVGAEDYKLFNFWANSTTQLIEILFQPFAGYESFASLDEIEAFFLRADPNCRPGFPAFRAAVERAWEKMDAYLDAVCDRALRHRPRAVGCSYGFQQANASLAILKRIRERSPETVTFMGGSGCSEYAGQAIADHMPQADYVFCGESDDVFAPALRLMFERKNAELKEKFPCVLVKGGTPGTHAAPDLDALPYPDYDDYFSQLENSCLKGEFSVVLPVESSRGCWWGCREKCRFCGLHNSRETLSYRKKTAARTAAELAYLSERYQVKRFLFADCILSPQDIRAFPKLLGGKGYCSYAEVKTNLPPEALEDLKKAGFLWLQPGIEALQDDLLLHMNKGNRAIRHVEFLKWATTLGLSCFWNLMTGFPQEKDEWYAETMELIPLLHHLNPPARNTFIYQRNSYFTVHAAQYGTEVRRAGFYEYFFGKDPAFLAGFAEYFEEASARALPYQEALEASVAAWRKAWENGAALTWFVSGDFMGIYDGRPCAPETRLVLSGTARKICENADACIRFRELQKRLPEVPEEELLRQIEDLKRRKLLLQIRDELLFLALPRDRLCRDPVLPYPVGRIEKET